MGLTRRYCLAAALAIAISACGGGGSESSIAQTQYPSTAVIQSNMQANYTSEQGSVVDSIQTCFRQWGISGNAVGCTIDAKEAAVQEFLNTVLTNIQAIKASEGIDNQAIASLLDGYQGEDIAWVSAEVLPGWGPIPQDLAPSYDASVNASYSNALFQFITITNDAIQSNMEANYTNEGYVVSSAVVGCGREAAANGDNGMAVTCAISAKEAAVQSFLGTIITNLQGVSASTSLDTTAIASLLSGYQAEDIAWLNTNPLGSAFGPIQPEFAPDYDANVNASYSNALRQLDAL